MIFFIIFPLFFLSAFGYEATVECDLWNQRYPNLTLTKVYSKNTSKICEDICINYLCPVSFFDPTNKDKIYALGSGCLEDLKKECEFSINFKLEPHTYVNYYIFASIYANDTGKKVCPKSLPKWVNYIKESVPNERWGWDFIRDIQFEADNDGINDLVESSKIIHPVTAPTGRPRHQQQLQSQLQNQFNY